MDKIQNQAPQSNKGSAVMQTVIEKERIFPPTNGNPHPAKPSFTSVKSVAEAALLFPSDNPEVERKLSRCASFWERKTSKMEYFFYKGLLTILYVIYAFIRYFQYQYNRIKIKILNLAYNPSNTPQLIRQDVLKLQKLPKRLAAVLDTKSEGEVGGGVSGLINDGSEIVAWTVSAGVKHLTLYDYDGVLKKNSEDFRNGIYNKLSKYYGPSNVPKFAVRIPHLNKVYFNSPSDRTAGEHMDPKSKKVAIEVSLLSRKDGRETIVDLTKTMAELCVKGELKLSEVTMGLVDSELTQLVGHEPDLLLYFGPSLDLQGYPPWHIRLTEFYWEEDNDEVTYSVFIRGLNKYSSCKINVGK